MGKLFSWIIIAVMAYAAIHVPQTIWRLMEIKLELLSQVAPAIILGLNIKSINKEAVFYGLVIGLALSLGLMFTHWEGILTTERPWGFHAGLWGLLANLITILVVSVLLKNEKKQLENPDSI